MSRQIALLIFISLAASVAAADSKINDNDVIDVIGDNIPRCAQQFVNLNPSRTSEVESIRQALVEVNCNGSRLTGILIDTPSGRLVLTAEHAVSGYNVDAKGKYTIGKTFDPAGCTIIDPDTKRRVFLDSSVSPVTGHPYKELSLDATTDWMILVLARRMPNHRPLMIGQAQYVTASTELLSGGLLAHIAGKGVSCLNFVQCHVHTIQMPPTTSIRYFNTDCSGARGNSGGPVTVTDNVGNPKLVGIYSGTTINKKRGSPWEADEMTAGIVSISGKFLSAIKETEADLSGGSTRL